MSKLFESASINGTVITNRFVRSATWEGLATKDGFATPELADVLVRLARGGVGLIITGHAYVSPEGKATPRQLGVFSDRQIAGLTELVRAVKDAGGKIFLQIAHAGVLAPLSLLGGQEPVGPSPVVSGKGPVGRTMSIPEIRATVQAFASAAGRAKTAGFDGIQIHGAHGYLVSQFLSPFFNKRNDMYGGPVENRTRMAVDTIEAIRRVVGSDYPVAIKINSEDFLAGGLTGEDMLLSASLLEKAGYDAIELSGGTLISDDLKPSRPRREGHDTPEPYYETAVRQLRDKVNIPLMLVGGIRTFGTAEKLVTEETTDYVAMCRPFIREPGLVSRWKSGDRSPALCASDNGCLKVGLLGKGVYCTLEAQTAKKHDDTQV